MSKNYGEFTLVELREELRSRNAKVSGRKAELVQQGAVLGIFIWVGQSKAKQILGMPTGVVYAGIMGMTRAVWVGQARVWVGHSLIAGTACVVQR